jgi:hypothetical protein
MLRCEVIELLIARHPQFEKEVVRVHYTGSGFVPQGSSGYIACGLRLQLSDTVMVVIWLTFPKSVAHKYDRAA